MSWKRRWSIIGALALAQVGVVICYQGFFKGSAAPAGQPAEPKVIVPASLPPSPPPPPAKNEVPAIPQGPPLPEMLPAAAVKAPPSKKEPEKLPIALLESVPLVPVPVAKEKEGNLLPVGAAEVVPVERLKPIPIDPKAGEIVLPPPEPKAPAGWARNPTTVVQVGKPPVSGAEGPPAVPLPGSLGEMGKAPMSPAIPPLPKHDLPSSPVQSPKPGLIPAAAPPAQEPTAADLANCPWILRVEIVKGRTLMTAQSGKDVQFRVSCDKLELQAPRGSIVACGNVSVSSEGLQGACDQLTIAWTKDHVVLEGRAELKCQRDGQEVDLKAAKLSLRLTSKGVETTRATAPMSTGKVRLRPHPVVVDEPSEGAIRASYNHAEGREPPISRQSKTRKGSIKMPEID